MIFSLLLAVLALVPHPRSVEIKGGEASIGVISNVTDRSLPAEGYRLMITADGVTILSSDAAGAFYARQTLEQLKKIRRNISQEKQENLIKLKKRNDEIVDQTNEMSKQIDKIQEHLRELKAVGKVKCEGTVYAGVKVYVREVLDEVKTDVKSVTFYYDRSFIKRGDYEPPALSQEEMNGFTAS